MSELELQTCPYNMSHQVAQYKMHIHLAKCRKQYPNCPKVTCPFDVTHVVNDVELNYHVATCEKRLMLDRQIYVPEESVQRSMEVPPPVQVPSEENWDDENCTSYVPDPSKKGNHVLIKAKGMTPSERRKVRMEGQRTYRPNEIVE